jgi:hypothetical protein
MFEHRWTTTLQLSVPFGKFCAQIGVRVSQDLDRLIGKYIIQEVIAPSIETSRD